MLNLKDLPPGAQVSCLASEALRPSQRLHLINLGVRDIKRASDFYKSLGWLPSSTGHEGFYKFDLGGYALCLLPLPEMLADLGRDREEETRFSGVVFVHLVDSVESVAKVLAQAVAAGGTLVKPATRTPWGVAGFFADPDGNLFEVDYEEVWVFDEAGKLVVDQLKERTC